ncbi:syntenin-1 [Paragonimus westermani]|uniref:Syntenin-1 n=1 Tax=Paragonimus westermani TaxID=34504 RepID=A0A5J4NSI5_9TREM|nr:syntenin-1 [Paragonimus westermani]
MSLYPTFEELKVDGLMQAQNQALIDTQHNNPDAYTAIATYMGLDLNNFHYNEFGELVPGPPPSGPGVPVTSPQQVAVCASGTIATTNSSRGEIKHGVRRAVLCKDTMGKVGVQLVDVDNGVFVSFVRTGSPAAMAGLRFGDQILSICDRVLAGHSGSKAMELIRKGPDNNIEVLVRDRPFERTIVINKSSSGDLGVSIDDGLIKAIHKDSSAARNGLLTDHQIVEVDGQNVLGLKDKQLKELLQRCGGSVRLTVVPYSIYKHMIKR